MPLYCEFRTFQIQNQKIVPLYMKSSLVKNNEPNKHHSNQLKKKLSKSNQRSSNSLISSNHLLNDVFGKKLAVQKNQSSKLNYSEKIKNLTCINLGVDDDSIEVLQEKDKPELKTKSRQISNQYEKKLKAQLSDKNQPLKKHGKNIQSKPQSKNQQKFSFLEPNKEKQNIMKIEKKLINNFVKKKDQITSAKSNFNETFKHFYNITNISAKKQSRKPTLSIKKEAIYELPAEIKKKKQDQSFQTTMASSKVSVNKQQNMNQWKIMRSKQKQVSQFQIKNKNLSLKYLKYPHKKFFPYHKKINSHEKLDLNSRSFLKSRRTCPISQLTQQKFTPWDHQPTERETLDYDY